MPEDMGMVLRQSAYSSNIKERMDASCAIFDREGRMIAQAEHIPVHLGAMPVAVGHVISRFDGEMSPGDQIILNNPYEGGTHLPDITVVKPVFFTGSCVGFCANRAHHADVGAEVTGSIPADSTSLQEEGMVISPSYLVREGQWNEELLSQITTRMRHPEQRIGDLQAQVGANRRGAKHIRNWIDSHSLSTFNRCCTSFFRYSSRKVRQSIREMEDGTYQAVEDLETDGTQERNLSIQCEVQIDADQVSFDFFGTSDEVPGNANAPYAVTMSCCYFVLRCLTDQSAPLNHGCYDAVEVHIPEESLLQPSSPRAVCTGNVETSQRIVDVLLEAFREALPEEVPAQSQGTMNNFLVSVEQEDYTIPYYETIGGGEGALPYRDGQSGVHTHMTNTKNTPVEALEHELPVRVRAYKLRSNSGGEGRYCGGEGIIREVEFRGGKGTFTIVSERRRLQPAGAKGGEPGQSGENMKIDDQGNCIELGARAQGRLETGDRIRIKTPGGGGFGTFDAGAGHQQA